MAEQTVRVGSVDMHVEVVGKGMPIVLLHGLGLSGALWSRVRDSIGPGRTLVLVDLRAAGQTRELVPEDLSLERWAGDVAGLIEALELDRPVLVGHSLGASIAIKLALERPELVRGVALIGADATLSNLAPRMQRFEEAITELGIDGWVAERWVQNPPFAAVSLERDPSMLDEYRALLLQNDPHDYIRQTRAIATAEDLAPRLGAVTQPALVLIGSLDDRTLPEHGRALAAELGNARSVELADVGHTLPLEAPVEVAAAVNEFIDEIAAAGNGNRVLRADTTPRNPTEGPFGHLDVRWIVGPDQGATLVSFGQSTYPRGATHENHHHPNAEEVVIVVSGRGTQIVGEKAHDVGPGDVCFIPRATPHRITGTSDDDLVILWAFGGASSIEDAGYVPLPEDAKEATT